MDKPLSLRIQEFQKTITEVIGNSGLPIFMIKYILKDLQDEIERVANDYAQKEIDEYYESLKQSEEKEEKPTKDKK